MPNAIELMQTTITSSEVVNVNNNYFALLVTFTFVVVLAFMVIDVLYFRKWSHALKAATAFMVAIAVSLGLWFTSDAEVTCRISFKTEDGQLYKRKFNIKAARDEVAQACPQKGAIYATSVKPTSGWFDLVNPD